MRYAAAYMLARLAGNESPSLLSILKILRSAGVKCDPIKVMNVINACEGRSFEELRAEDITKLETLVPIETEEFDDDYRCLMFFPTSGRMGFDKVTISDELPPIEILRDMIAYETQLRLSEPVQDLIESCHTNEAALT